MGAPASREPIAGIADPSSLLGKLQRGRGEGWREAVDDVSSARELVARCIAEDPRWDHQVESRAYYYGALGMLCGIPSEALGPEVLAGATSRSLAVQTLAQFAKRGRQDAIDVLAMYLDSPEYEEAVFQLNALAALDGREGVLWDRLSDEEILDLSHMFRELPWDSWRHRSPKLAGLLGGRKPVTTPRPSADELPDVDKDLEEVLRHPWLRPYPRRLVHRLTHGLRPGEGDRLANVVGSGEIHQQLLALQVLGRLGDPRALNAAVELTRSTEPGALGGAARRYLTGLDAGHVLELGRGWISASDGRYRAATGILAEHATPADRDLVLHALAIAWEHRDFYATCDLLDALARHRHADDLPIVLTVWREAEYSYCRQRIARGLSGFEAIREAVAEEALWDCEHEVRLLAIEHVDISKEAICTRIRELSRDPAEDAEMVRAATAALGPASQSNPEATS